MKEAKGRWTQEEHELFLEALRTYGKDWTMLQRHIKTRGITNIRAHAQKFLMKLVKTLEYSNLEEDEIEYDPESEIGTAKFFHNILSNKMHKIYSSVIKQEEKEEKKANEYKAAEKKKSEIVDVNMKSKSDPKSISSKDKSSSSGKEEKNIFKIEIGRPVK